MEVLLGLEVPKETADEEADAEDEVEEGIQNLEEGPEEETRVVVYRVFERRDDGTLVSPKMAGTSWQLVWEDELLVTELKQRSLISAFSNEAEATAFLTTLRQVKPIGVKLQLYECEATGLVRAPAKEPWLGDHNFLSAAWAQQWLARKKWWEEPWAGTPPKAQNTPKKTVFCASLLPEQRITS